MKNLGNIRNKVGKSNKKWKYSRLARIVALIPYETINLFKLYKIFITLTRALNLKFIKPGSYLKIDAFWGFSGYESMFFHMFFLAALTRVSASGNLSFLGGPLSKLPKKIRET